MAVGDIPIRKCDAQERTQDIVAALESQPGHAGLSAIGQVRGRKGSLMIEPCCLSTTLHARDTHRCVGYLSIMQRVGGWLLLPLFPQTRARDTMQLSRLSVCCGRPSIPDVRPSRLPAPGSRLSVSPGYSSVAGPPVRPTPCSVAYEALFLAVDKVFSDLLDNDELQQTTKNGPCNNPWQTVQHGRRLVANVFLEEVEPLDAPTAL